MYRSCAFTLATPFNLSRPGLKCPYKKRHLLDRGAIRTETVKCSYGAQSSALKGGSNDSLCQDDVSPSPTTEVLSTINHDDEGLSKRVLRFVIQFADIAQPVAKQGDVVIELQLVTFLANVSFKMSMFTRYIKILEDCEDDTIRK